MTVDEILEYCRCENRVCPVPEYWNQLYRLLPETRQGGSGWEPPLPLILAAWHHTTDSDKQERLKQHIRWAHDHGALSRIAKCLTSLREEQWHHA
jgi:hypothetical protein